LAKTTHCLFSLPDDSHVAWIHYSIPNLIKSEPTMKKNMGTIDKLIRTVIAIVVAVLYFTGQISGTAAIILGLLAVVFILTSLVGTCPLYLPFGLSTKKE